jgi:hypothetical protein
LRPGRGPHERAAQYRLLALRGSVRAARLALRDALTGLFAVEGVAVIGAPVAG